MKNKLNLTDLTSTELSDKLREEKGAYTKLKLNHAVSPMENPMKIRFTRKNIARLETEVRRRKGEAAAQSK